MTTPTGFVQVAVTDHRCAGVSGLGELSTGEVDGSVSIDAEDRSPRHEHLAQYALGDLHRARDDHALLRREPPVRRDHVADFRRRDVLAVLARVGAHEAYGQVGGLAK